MQQQKLIDFIKSKQPISKQDMDLITQYFEPVLFPGNRIIEGEGKIPKYLYYIISGYLRLFYYHENGDEITTHINCPPGFFTSYSSFVNGTKASDNVECITECELLRITKGDLESLTSKSPAIKNFSINVFQQSIAYNESRSVELATLSAEQRYQQLIRNYPGILHHVPISYIASFLGMKPESLSRIRRRLIL